MIIWDPFAPGGQLDTLSGTFWSPRSKTPPQPGQPQKIKTKPKAFVKRKKPLTTKAKTIRKKRAPRKTKYNNPKYNILLDALYAYRLKRDGNTNSLPAYYEMLSALKRGIVDLNYWEELTPASLTYFTSIPSTAIRTPQPAYAYRDPGNLATQVSYPDGTESIGPPSHTGEKITNFFADTSLTFGRATFKLNRPLTNTTEEVLFVLVDTTQTASADLRGSRPMLSYIIEATLCDTNSPALTSAKPPVRQTGEHRSAKGKRYFNFYHRTKLPLTAPPYFNWTIYHQHIIDIGTYARRETTANPSHLALTFAPRPLFGRGYNNNTLVSITAPDTPRIFQIKKALGGFFRNQFIVATTGARHSYPNPNSAPLSMHSPQLGLILVYDPTLGMNRTYYCTGSLAPLAFDAPWELQEFWLATGATPIAHATTDGFIVYIYDALYDKWYYYRLDTTGHLLEITDSVNTPSLYTLCTLGTLNMAYSKAENLFYHYDPIAYQEQVYIKYDPVGGESPRVYVASPTNGHNGPYFSTESNIIVKELINLGSTYNLNLYTVSGTTLSLLATTHLGSSSLYGYTTSGNDIFIWPRDITIPPQQIAPDGTTTLLQLQPDIQMSNATPNNTFVITG